MPYILFGTFRTDDAVDKGPTPEELSVQGVHEDIRIGEGPSWCPLVFPVFVSRLYVKGENIAIENYVKLCLHDISRAENPLQNKKRY